MNAEKKLALFNEIDRVISDREGWTVSSEWPLARHESSGFIICALRTEHGYRWQLRDIKKDLAKQRVGEDMFLALSCMATWLGLQLEEPAPNQTIH